MTDRLDDTWELIRDHLRQAIPAGAYHLWVPQFHLEELSEGQLVLSVPDHATRWVADRFGHVLAASAAAVVGTHIQVDVVGRSALADRRGRHPGARRPGHGEPDLNPGYTFDQFVIGEGNRLAHAAALAVAELPGQAYNPLFICGPPGVGKTHLLHSIAAYARGFTGASVRCVTADLFTTGFVQALQGGSIDSFKAAYRSADLLLVDDVQFLQDKARTEEEFFHTFNALYETGSQLVFTSDRPPADIDALEDRLRERFASGLVADVAAPDFETRLTILRKWARHQGAAGIENGVLELLAARVTGNVRALQGALTHLIAVASLEGREVDAELMESALGRRVGARRREAPSVRDVQEVTCRAFGISREELLSSSRAGRVAWPRQLAMYLARQHTKATLPTIGREFGGRDHTTVLYAWRRARAKVAEDPEIEQAAARLTDELQALPGDREG